MWSQQNEDNNKVCLFFLNGHLLKGFELSYLILMKLVNQILLGSHF